MVRCNATTKSGRRCKLPSLANDTLCGVHVCNDMPALEEILQNTITHTNDFVTMPVLDHPTQPPTNVLEDITQNTVSVVETTPQSCKHVFCLLNTNECCACNDKRPHDTQYMRYIESVGDVPIGRREDEYCMNCRRAFAFEHIILDRYYQFLAIEPSDMNRNELLLTAHLLSDELNNLINRLMQIENSLSERTGNSMNLT